MKVTVTKVLDEFWGTSEDLEKLTDPQVLELIEEDYAEFFEGASITIERNPLDSLGVSKRHQEFINETLASDEISLGKLIERMAAVYQIVRLSPNATRAVGAFLLSDSPGCGDVE